MTLLDDNTDDQIVIDHDKNYLEDLVGEGKKFKTPEDLAKGKFYADQTIELMKRRMDEMRQDYLKEREQNVTRAQLEDVINQLSQRQASSDFTPAKDDVKPMFDPKELDTLVSSKISEFDRLKKEEENANLIKDKAIERLGTEYKTVLNKRAVELGLSSEEVESMARRNPKLFIKTFDLDAQSRESFQAPIRSSQGFAPTSGHKRTWSYYQSLKAKDPKSYFDQKTQQQMMDDYASLGPAFEDGNFHQFN